jgi:mRNA interferase YafQ
VLTLFTSILINLCNKEVYDPTKVATIFIIYATTYLTSTALDTDLLPVFNALVNDQPLEPRHHDHALTGDWKDHRDCHIKPDLLLIYNTFFPDTLQLVRLGSHSELGL